MPLSETELRRKVRWQTISMVFQGAMNCLTPVYTVGRQMMETLQQHKEHGPAAAAEASSRATSASWACRPTSCGATPTSCREA